MVPHVEPPNDEDGHEKTVLPIEHVKDLLELDTNGGWYMMQLKNATMFWVKQDPYDLVLTKV